MPEQPLHGSDKPKVVSTDNARQGEVLHRVRYVLAFGIIFVIIAFLIVYLMQK